MGIDARTVFGTLLRPVTYVASAAVERFREIRDFANECAAEKQEMLAELRQQGVAQTGDEPVIYDIRNYSHLRKRRFVRYEGDPVILRGNFPYESSLEKTSEKTTGVSFDNQVEEALRCPLNGAALLEDAIVRGA